VILAYRWSFSYEWEINFTLRAVNDGGLEILPEIKIKKNKTRASGWEVQPEWRRCVEKMTEHVKDVLEHLKKAIYNDLDEGLKNQQTMYLPGEGLFPLSAPTFNQRGDLLATLTWNG
jgi:hypothetical protein